MATRNQKTKEETGKRRPAYTVFARVHRKRTTDSGSVEYDETLTELGAAWETEGGNLQVSMFVEPLEWRDARVTERRLLLVVRKP